MASEYAAYAARARLLHTLAVFKYSSSSATHATHPAWQQSQ
jgi:hypothetical protein